MTRNQYHASCGIAKCALLQGVRLTLAIFLASILEVTVATADSRRCEDNGGARTYLSQPLEGMTGEVIADHFISAV